MRFTNNNPSQQAQDSSSSSNGRQRQQQQQQQQPTSWMGFKDKGKRHYERGEYELALEAYKAALTYSSSSRGDVSALAIAPPQQERQILLSNMVACRLKIGGSAQAAAAVQEAKQCIAIQPTWAKAHVRLASAYIASGHSNDACNALQTALRYDPGNTLARQMLMRELRRDHAAAAAAAAAASESDLNGNGDHVDDYNAGIGGDDHNNNNNNSEGASSSNRQRAPTDQDDPLLGQRQQYRQDDDDDDDDAIDDSLSITDRLQFAWARFVAWYESQSNDTRLLLKAMIVLLALYVGFGGRFGLDQIIMKSGSSNTGASSSTHDHHYHHRGNYGAGNVYEQYRRSRRASSTASSSGYSGSSYSYYDDHNNRGDSHSQYAGSSSSNSNPYYTTTTRSRMTNNGYSSYYGASEALPSLALLLAVAYVMHLNGINPIHALWMMNGLGGGGAARRRRMRRGGFMFGGGGGGWPIMGGGGGIMWGRYGGMRPPRARGFWY